MGLNRTNMRENNRSAGVNWPTHRVQPGRTRRGPARYQGDDATNGGLGHSAQVGRVAAVSLQQLGGVLPALATVNSGRVIQFTDALSTMARIESERCLRDLLEKGQVQDWEHVPIEEGLLFRVYLDENTLDRQFTVFSAEADLARRFPQIEIEFMVLPVRSEV